MTQNSPLNPHIAEQLEAHRSAIRQAVSSAGRAEGAVRLIAVSKTFAVEAIQAAIDKGQTVFGESRVQEAVPKIQVLPQGLEWHFIGHLQKNKVKDCLPWFDWLHSLDQLSLAQRLEDHAATRQQPLQVLVQANIQQDGNKRGFATLDEVRQLCDAIAQFQHIQVRGLMTMGVYQGGETTNRRIFSTARKWLEALRSSHPELRLSELSMGMSEDYLWAIQEGATMVRIGSGIFGKRN